MSQNLSTKNLYKVFRDISINHRQIGSFGSGDIFRVNERSNLEHPTLWVDLYQASLSHNKIDVRSRIYVFDIVDQADTAENDIHSNTLLVINDVITLLRKHYELINNDFTENASFFKHSFNDRVAGWMVEVNLEVPTTYGECDIAVENLQPFPQDDDLDPFSPPISEFLLASPGKLWRITITDEGNLQSQEVV